MSAALDTLQRRNDRFSPVTTGKTKRLTDRDIMWFEKIHTHGPLSSTQLRAYSRHYRKSDKKATEQLTDLFNEDTTPHGGTYLTRPIEQAKTLDARCNDLVYDLTPHSKQALVDAGLWSDHAPKRAGWWLHSYMAAHVTSSIELATMDTANVRYISRHEILERGHYKLYFSLKEKDKSGNPLKLFPDGLFGLEYIHEGGKKYRFFLVEIDRNNEPIESKAERKTYSSCIEHYIEVVRSKQYKDALGVPSCQVLNVTISEGHKDNLVQCTAKLSDNGKNNYMLFQHLDGFSRFFKPPPTMHELFTKPWDRAGTDPFFICTVDGSSPHGSV